MIYDRNNFLTTPNEIGLTFYSYFIMFIFYDILWIYVRFFSSMLYLLERPELVILIHLLILRLNHECCHDETLLSVMRGPKHFSLQFLMDHFELNHENCLCEILLQQDHGYFLYGTLLLLVREFYIFGTLPQQSLEHLPLLNHVCYLCGTLLLQGCEYFLYGITLQLVHENCLYEILPQQDHLRNTLGTLLQQVPSCFLQEFLPRQVRVYCLYEILSKHNLF